MSSGYEAGPKEEHGKGLLFLLVGMMAMAGVFRLLDIAILLFGTPAPGVSRKKLLRAYVRMWRGVLGRSPFKEGDFARVKVARGAGLSLSELTYGETPVFTAISAMRRAGLKPGATVLDLGAGRGRVLIAAAFLGAHARGVDILPDHVALTQSYLSDLADVQVADAAKTSLDDVDFVFLTWTCMSERTRRKLEKKLLEAKDGTRFLCVSHSLEMQGMSPVFERKPWFTWGKADLFVVERRKDETER
ncbi:MAG: class I SAM-dependent methyltransferase [Deltaproteobacteria bacterium]|nr:class I SAM-dependent methyltransferase [Deltaproteobacteria bacterium]